MDLDDTKKYRWSGETFIRHEHNFLHYIVNKDLCLLSQAVQIKSAIQKVPFVVS